MTSRDKRMTIPSRRRNFLGQLAGGVASLAGLAGARPHALAARSAAPDQRAQPDDDWMDALTATHRTVFDMSAHKNGKPLSQAKNYLDAWRDAFKVPEHDLNLVIGVHGEALPVVVTDAVWARFRIGEQYEVVDGRSKTAYTRNVFTAANAMSGGVVTADQAVDSLQKRGVRFLICMNTIAGATRKLVEAGLGSAEEIRPALLHGLLPGVIVVPAMVVALTQLQERGLKYTKIA